MRPRRLLHGPLLAAAPLVLALLVGCQADSDSTRATATEDSARAATEAVDPEVVERAVNTLLDAQVAAWNAADMDGFLAPYWRDPELTFYSGGSIVKGYDLFAARFRQRYTGADSAGMGSLTFRNLEIVPLGDDSAMARGEWHLRREGVEPTGGLFTLILRQLPDGWRIVHDQTSTFEDPPPADDEPMAA